MIEWTNGPGGITPEDRRNYIHGIFSETTYGAESPENGVIDLLSDLMHYCHLRGIDFYESSSTARTIFLREKRAGLPHVTLPGEKPEPEEINMRYCEICGYNDAGRHCDRRGGDQFPSEPE